MNFDKPIRLITSRAWRTYIGGKNISALHGQIGEDDHFPEEWLMSTVSARNVGREDIVEGLTAVAGSDLTLADLVARYPEEMLGASHRASHGDTLGVLVKLLDSAVRLSVQVHPTREAAKRLFNSEFGKTECWYVIGERTIGGEKPCIYLGFKEGVTREKWKSCFDTQDIPAMLGCLHKIEVKPGDTYIIHGGVPHAIGAGCFLVEIQEPTDYTVRTERIGFDGSILPDASCHQGLGFERMFDVFEYQGKSLAETVAAYGVKSVTEQTDGATVCHVIHPGVTGMFALDKIEVSDSVSLTGGRFYGIYVMEGEGEIGGIPFGKCDHFFIPAKCGDLTVKRTGQKPLSFIRFFGPQ